MLFTIGAVISASSAFSQSLEEGNAAVRQGDFESAISIFSHLAAQGVADAQVSMGFLHANGMGVPVDTEIALKWYKKAAEQGDPNGLAILGAVYRDGILVEQNGSRAISFFTQSAQAGNYKAMLSAGLMYEEADGVAADYITAGMWYEIAAAHGGDVMFRDMLIETMDPHEVILIKQLALQCINAGFENCSDLSNEQRYARLADIKRKASEKNVDELNAAIINGWPIYQQYVSASPLEINAHGSSGFSPLVTAVKTGDARIVQDLLARGFDPDHINLSVEECNLTPLQTAVYFNNYEIFKVLSDAGATKENVAKAEIHINKSYEVPGKKDFLGNPLKTTLSGKAANIEPVMLALLGESQKIYENLKENLNWKNVSTTRCIRELFPKVKNTYVNPPYYDINWLLVYSGVEDYHAVINQVPFNADAWAEALNICMENRVLNCFDLVFDKSASKDFASPFTQSYHHSQSLFLSAVRLGDLRVLELLIDLGADPQYSGLGFMSALEFHLENGGSKNDEIGKLLTKETASTVKNIEELFCTLTNVQGGLLGQNDSWPHLGKNDWSKVKLTQTISPEKSGQATLGPGMLMVYQFQDMENYDNVFVGTILLDIESPSVERFNLDNSNSSESLRLQYKCFDKKLSFVRNMVGAQ